MKPGRDEAAAKACLELLTLRQRERVQSYRVDMEAAYNAGCQEMCQKAKPVIDRFHVAKHFVEAVDGVRKKITRQYKSKLTKAQRKEFRSRMWEFRRDPASLTPKELAKLEAMVDELPELRKLHELRVKFLRIFDEAPTRRKADVALAGWVWDVLEAFPEMKKTFLATFERWQEGIMNYFDRRQTSSPLEGLKNKALVIPKRAYGIKSATSLWTRLMLDLNLAGRAIGQSIAKLRKIVAAFRRAFSASCTEKRKSPWGHSPENAELIQLNIKSAEAPAC